MQDVAASGNNVFVTWCDDKTGDMEIYVRKSTDGGQTFGNTTMSMPTLQRGFGGGVDDRKAPIATSGDNMYISWWTNKTGNDEVMFRASTDGGTTFADKINLSNSTGAESQDVEIAADGDNVIVTWWERNQTAEEPVAKISTDNRDVWAITKTGN